MTSRELRQKAKQLTAEARQITDKAESEERELSAEESANFDKYIEDALQAREKAEKLEQLAALEAEQREVKDPAKPVEVRDEKRDPKVEDEAREAAFEVALYPKRYERQKFDAEQRALQADLDVSGGYTVAPPQFNTKLWKDVDNLTFFRSLATIWPVSSSDSIQGVSLDADPADPAWTAEIGSLSEDSTMAFGGRSLSPNQLTKLIKVSDKLLMVSALPIQQIVRERLAYKLGTTAENVFLNGTGAGQPLGVFTASSQGISTGQDVSTGNSTTAFTFDGLKEAKYSIKPQYWSRLNWIFHRDAVKMAAKLKDGEGQYQWQSSVVGGEPDRLLGFPVRMSEYAPSTFTTGLYVGILGDFSQYVIAELQQLSVRRFDELYAANSQVGFAIKSWFDGMPMIEEAFARVTLA